jgi:hypothetical protein
MQHNRNVHSPGELSSCSSTCSHIFPLVRRPRIRFISIVSPTSLNRDIPPCQSSDFVSLPFQSQRRGRSLFTLRRRGSIFLRVRDNFCINNCAFLKYGLIRKAPWRRRKLKPISKKDKACRQLAGQLTVQKCSGI